MEGIIQKYHEVIPLTPLQLYSIIQKYKPNYATIKDSGFPIATPDSSEIKRFPCPAFDCSNDPAKQKCKRCKKPVSLLEEEWWLDEAGCSYHPGRRTFLGGPDNGLYSCCKGVSEEDGCTRNSHHVCEFRPVDGQQFLRARHNRHVGPNVFALDCEMVYTTVGMEVVRVSMVSAYGTTVYDSLVRPENPVLDYNTAYSGVKEEDLDDITTTLSDVQESLLKVLDAKSILIGHGLENDLLGLHLCHSNVVDTSLVFEHERGFPFRHSLKNLAQKYLETSIHSGETGHDSVEDAKASLALVLHKVHHDLKEKRLRIKNLPLVTSRHGPNVLVQPGQQGFCCYSHMPEPPLSPVYGRGMGFYCSPHNYVVFFFTPVVTMMSCFLPRSL